MINQQSGEIDFKKIEERLGTQYIRNEDCEAFLRHNRYRVNLNNFVCFAYGFGEDRNKRDIIMLRFLGHNKQNKTHYLMQTFANEHPLQDVFWVTDTQHLRRNFLKFKGTANFFRVTFLYDPITNEIYRLHNLRFYLHLPVYQIFNELIFESPSCSFSYDTPKMNSLENTSLIDDNIRKQIINSNLDNIFFILQSLINISEAADIDDLVDYYYQEYHASENTGYTGESAPRRNSLG